MTSTAPTRESEKTRERENVSSHSSVMAQETLKIGRPTSCTEDVILAIVRATERGLSLAAAASAAGVARATFTNWRRRGAQGEEPYATLVARVTRARATAEERMAAVVEQAAASADDKVSLSAAQWWLERRRPERWARKDRPQLTVQTENPAALSDDELQARIAELAAEHGWVRALPSGGGAGGGTGGGE